MTRIVGHCASVAFAAAALKVVMTMTSFLPVVVVVVVAQVAASHLDLVKAVELNESSVNLSV